MGHWDNKYGVKLVTFAQLSRIMKDNINIEWNKTSVEPNTPKRCKNLLNYCG